MPPVARKLNGMAVLGIEKAVCAVVNVLATPEVDFVHDQHADPDHAEQTIDALKAGKHVACTVPMATSVEECRQIVELSRGRRVSST